ncbi:HEPN domain-containing protein [Ferruginibacter sp. SUN106]|uniref:HEPN domain-containing protein n=1 Tax=Ferruginibacter sp. SUN106 TaxID=2978348 RepID=UPI003D364724
MNLPTIENCGNHKKVLTALILKISTVEKIYLLGASMCRQRTESIFGHPAAGCNRAGHYYLLVLVNKDTCYGHNDLQDRIENTCRNVVPVTVIILSINQFTSWHAKGHRFVATVLANAELLYGVDDWMVTTKNTLNETGEKKGNDDYWTEVYNRANEFIEGTKWYLLRRQNKMALFMLQQAAVLLLCSIFKKHSGLHMPTHNLDKLLRYCSLVTHRITDLFPKDNEKELRLFQLLQQANAYVKHKQEFVITKHDAAILLERIVHLQKMYKISIQGSAVL